MPLPGASIVSTRLADIPPRCWATRGSSRGRRIRQFSSTAYVHPLAGAQAFTWEVIFRADLGGAAEQRFFHLQERDPKTGEDTATRMLFEIRVIGNQWALDSFALSGTESLALLDRTKLHSLGAWHAVAAVYDGREFRNYVDGQLQGSGPLHLAPQGEGHTSIGTRINRVNYFKGAVLEARMTRRALAPSEFLKPPN